MTTRRIQFSNVTRLLTTDEDRLLDLKARVDAIASDLAELETMSEEERRQAADLRNDVLERFRRLGTA